MPEIILSRQFGKTLPSANETFETLHRGKASLALSWKVTSLPGDFLGFKSAQAENKLAHLTYQQKRLALIKEATKAYYQYMLAQKEQQVREEAVSLAKKNFLLAKAKFHLEKMTKLAYLEAKIVYEQEKSSLLAHEEKHLTAQAGLNLILGVEVSKEWEIEEKIMFPQEEFSLLELEEKLSDNLGYQIISQEVKKNTLFNV